MTAVALHAVEQGPADGPALLLGPSLGTTAEVWSPQLAPLARAGVRAVAYDHRGHGGSPVPPAPYDLADLGADALALLDARGIERAAVGGVSLGGLVAVRAVDHWARSERAMRTGEALPPSRFPAVLALIVTVGAAALLVATLL